MWQYDIEKIYINHLSLFRVKINLKIIFLIIQYKIQKFIIKYFYNDSFLLCAGWLFFFIFLLKLTKHFIIFSYLFLFYPQNGSLIVAFRQAQKFSNWASGNLARVSLAGTQQQNLIKIELIWWVVKEISL